MLVWVLALTLDFDETVPPPVVYVGEQNVFFDSRLSVFDSQGRLRHVMEARQVDYLPDSNQFQFSATKIAFETARGRVLIASDTGRFLPEDTVFILDDEVLVQRMVGDRVGEALTTSALTVLTEEKIAHSGAHAKIKQGARVLTGEGVEINLEDGKIRLLKNVRMDNEQTNEQAKE